MASQAGVFDSLMSSRIRNGNVARPEFCISREVRSRRGLLDDDSLDKESGVIAAFLVFGTAGRARR
jgi:hypothetical protein